MSGFDVIEGDVTLYDASGNPIVASQDGSDYRLGIDGKVAKGDSALVHLDALDTASGRGRLKASLYSPEGEAVAFTTVPENASAIHNHFVENGGSDDLLVDGSVTPVVFAYLADPTKDISLQEIHFTMSSNSITFGTGYFGATSGPLTNGLLVEVVSGGIGGEVANLTRNESFVNFASPGGFQWIVSSKDLLSSAYVVGGGLKLVAGSGDQVKVTVRDDLSSAGVYLKCFVKANELG